MILFFQWYEDLYYGVEIIKESPSYLYFNIYRPESIPCNLYTPEAIMEHILLNKCNTDMVTTEMEYSVKSTGCSNLFVLDPVALHFCTRVDLDRISEVLKRCFDIAKELFGDDWDD